ncbi:DNA-processing protein DprA [Caldicellulosiruptoraceae bacterium PP1]
MDIYAIWLYSINGIGPIRFRMIKERYNTIKNFYENRKDANQKFISEDAKKEIFKGDLSFAERIIEKCNKEDIHIIYEDDDIYPDDFKNYEDSPPIFYLKGDKEILKNTNKISIIGTRYPTYYGKKVATELSEMLAQNNIIIVSGMAKGIDTFAHTAALKYNKTIAVLGCGVDVVYPRENTKLYMDIIENGCVLSEYPPETKPDKGNFPQRNRIISMLSDILVVVEAPLKSGIFSTVDAALDQGKDIYVVPGNITSPKSAGTNKLIREGAKVICSIDDFLQDIGITDLKNNDKNDQEQLTNDEKYILSLIETEGAMDVEKIAELSKRQISDILSILTMLEIKGKIQKERASKYIKI